MPELIESGCNKPKRKRGAPTKAEKLEKNAWAQRIYEFILATKDKIEIHPGGRGWGYLLENARLIDKSDLDRVEKLIGDARKSGALPWNICSEDSKRSWHNIEELDNEDPVDEAGRIVRTVQQWITRYQPYSFWEGKPFYIQLLVEKTDLREIFLPVCKRWHIPIANGGGWADINVRGQLMERFKDNLEEGQIPVILYCGDHDPAGFRISDCMPKNIADLSNAVGWNPDNLIVDRFGLNRDFIDEHNLVWIDNLETSGTSKIIDLADPKHKDHAKSYVQNYIKAHGARKCEANVLVTAPQAGRDLCEAAILKYLVDPTLPEQFTAELQPNRDELRDAVKSALAEYLEDETD